MEDDIFLQLTSLLSGNDSKPTVSSSGPASPYGAVDSTMFKDDDIVYPDIKPKKAAGQRRKVVVIDDDFSTLDLLKIYLQRDYDVEVFDNPKNAIFYLNGVIPDLIFLDCYLNVMSTKKVLEIIRTYRELADVPIIYLAEPSEQAAIESKLPDGVVDIISRPVSRMDMQRMLDSYIRPEEEDEEPAGSDTDGIL